MLCKCKATMRTLETGRDTKYWCPECGIYLTVDEDNDYDWEVPKNSTICVFCDSEMDLLDHGNLLQAQKLWCPNCGAIRTGVHDYDKQEEFQIYWRKPKREGLDENGE